MSYPQHDWWRQAVVYQIYPKSFQDSGDKGTGDRRSIMAMILPTIMRLILLSAA